MEFGVLYLTGSLPSNPKTLAKLRALDVGVMTQPSTGYSSGTLDGWRWALDNGCFSASWDADRWLSELDKRQGLPGCLFAVVPDVVGDHAATLERWRVWLPEVADRGYPPAFVAQNGCGPDDVPWDECAAVFIGGDDAYKLSHSAELVVRRAKRLGKWAHMGRVNSLRRLRIAVDWGCDSVDGTFLAFGPDLNTDRLADWFSQIALRPSLFAS